MENEELLCAAAHDGDVDKLKTLLDSGVDVTYFDKDGLTPLMHAAKHGHAHIVQSLLDAGAPWNALSPSNLSAGDFAMDAGHQDAFDVLLNAAIRAELVLGTIARRENGYGGDYLSDRVSFSEDKLMDSESKAVMMAWEKPLMEAHAKAVCSSGGHILNIGFGMGLVDTAIQQYNPSSHTIIEAHPEVYKKMLQLGWGEKENVKLIFGRWQDVLDKLDSYDGIFFDTYGEYYEDMRDFHQHLSKLLKPEDSVSCNEVDFICICMTSLSAFFISRRSRIGRSGFLDVGEDEEELDTSYSYLHRNSHQNSIRRHRSPNHQRTSRRDSHLRHHPSRRAVNSGSETISLDQSRSQTHSANVTNPQNNARRARIRFIGNERLPSAVLLARERLLQRLRGVSVSENSDTSNESNSETVIMREQLAETDPNTEHSLEKSDRPRGLSQAAMNSLQVEIFKKPITNDGVVGGDILPPERDCSICLDSFFDGEKLICLPCGHRFHYNCLCHWLHICGDCPYCRTGINVDSSSLN